MIRHSIRALIPTCVALTFLAIHPAAQAETRPGKKQVASVPVSYADLDLSQPTDARVLLDRIKDAAYRACGGDPRGHVNYTFMPVRVETAFRECREDAVANAIATVRTQALARADVAISAMLDMQMKAAAGT